MPKNEVNPVEMTTPSGVRMEEFDISDELRAELVLKINDIHDFCKKHDIPLFLAACTKVKKEPVEGDKNREVTKINSSCVFVERRSQSSHMKMLQTVMLLPINIVENILDAAANYLMQKQAAEKNNAGKPDTASNDGTPTPFVPKS